MSERARKPVLHSIPATPLADCMLAFTSDLDMANSHSLCVPGNEGSWQKWKGSTAIAGLVHFH